MTQAAEARVDLPAPTSYDVAIVGAGLAGIALSIQLAKKGFRVIIFEKELFPFHRVCGEYISMESWDFLTNLGLDLAALRPAMINKLQLSSTTGKKIDHDLAMGGFGISRYLLDFSLTEIAKTCGVVVAENTKVNNVQFDKEHFIVDTNEKNYTAKVACGCFGKRSNLDVKWKRSFITEAKNDLNNYISVKYHVRMNFPADTIALHNFENGYCGIVKIEADRYNLCYLTTASNLRAAGGNITEMEKKILSKNPLLEQIFKQAAMLHETPLTISQISFAKKSQVVDHVLMVGDAAGMITPLCGNGMSMALHASKLAAKQVALFLEGSIGRKEMEDRYRQDWLTRFSGRMRNGRWIQQLFTYKWLTNWVIGLLKRFPRLMKWVVTQTHGEKF